VPPCFRAPQAKKNVSQNRLFCQVSFSFFYLFFSVFFAQPNKQYQLKKHHLNLQRPENHRIKKNKRLIKKQFARF